MNNLDGKTPLQMPTTCTLYNLRRPHHQTTELNLQMTLKAFIGDKAMKTQNSKFSFYHQSVSWVL